MSKTIVFILLVLSSVLMFGQSGTSIISGTIKDPSGSPIPSAKVKVVNQGTGVSADTSSNDAGIFRVGSLVPGTYRVEVEVEGFERLVRSPLVLQVGQVLTADLTLAVGKVTEAAPLTESQSSNVSLPNRSASSLAALSPGVVMIDTGAGTAEN